MGVFRELDLLVLRPFVKKKIFSRTPLRVHASAVFKTCRTTGSLIIRAGFQKFRKHLHEGPKNTQKNEKFKIYFLTYKPRKKGILKGASPDGKNNFFLVFEF